MAHATTDYERSAYWDDDFRPLMDAGKGILEVLRQDETSSHGDLFLRINASANKAGTNAPAILEPEANPSHRYFRSDKKNDDDEKNGTAGLVGRPPFIDVPPVHHTDTVLVPTRLQDMMQNVRTQMLMGLFPEAGLAWVALDDTVHLWSYRQGAMGPAGEEEGSQFLSFQVPGGRNQVIVSVGLAPPKRGVFNSMVEWCLIVTTKEEAILCCIAKKTGTDIYRQPTTLGGGWAIVPTRFVIPTDFHSFYSVASTKTGRVFLGGADGNLYELDYDLLIQNQEYRNGISSSLFESSSSHDDIERRLDEFYDGDDGNNGTVPCPGVLFESSSLNSVKRIWDTAFSSPSTDGERARKCRKLNHSHSSVVNRILPDFLTQMGSAILGNSTIKEGGPIKQIVVDEERQVVYTLSSLGWICALDMATVSSTTEQSATPGLSLAAVVDAPSTARIYLENVSRGRSTPPSTMGYKSSIGILKFLGGGDAAKAGVGSMDGARRILQMVETSKSRNGRQRGRNQGDPSILTPVSVVVVPKQESNRITLVAITAGGLRYYMSTLAPQTMDTGPVNPPFGTPRHRHPLRPFSRFTLCHIRGPPPITTTGYPSNGQDPTVLQNWTVDAACYRLGAFVVAFTPTNARSSTGSRGQGQGSNNGSLTGQSSIDVVVAATPDEAAKEVKQMVASNNNGGSQPKVSSVTPGGLCEMVSFAVSNSMDSFSKTTPATLPGGRVYDIEPASFGKNAVLDMTVHSKTPTDADLGLGLIPPFIPPKPKKTRASSGATSSALVSAPGLLVSSMPLMVLWNIATGRPVRQGLEIRQPNIPSNERVPGYRVSKRSGSEGFSFSAADNRLLTSSSVGTPRSPRLNPWLLNPAAVPLDSKALEHLHRESATKVYALNPGGVHSFQSLSLLDQLSLAISNARSNSKSDPDVTSFFVRYGYKEACAMCFLLAIKPSNSQEMKRWSMMAAMARANFPKLVRVDPTDTQTEIASQSCLKDDAWMPSGYSLELSYLCSGAFMALSRVLRPIWFKPAVVVTEGRVVKRGTKTTTTPAKVELLLDEVTLEQIRQPLLAFQGILNDFFKAAVVDVPLKRKAEVYNDGGDRMDIDVSDNLLTSNLQLQYLGRVRGFNGSSMSEAEAQALARRIEERKVHSLFRLVSRSTQLLTLLAALRRAHSMPELPEVNWGLLHGITVSQLVETSAGQERVDNLLNELVTSVPHTSSGKAAVFSTADCNNLADALAKECFFYFSPGTRFAYLGFQAAQDALNTPSCESRRLTLQERAIGFLRKAADHWCSPALVTGRILHTTDLEGYAAIAQRAKDNNSPLAKACWLLSELHDSYAVEAMVDICLQTSQNFKKKVVASTAIVLSQVIGATEPRMYSWEQGLYHKRQDAASATVESGSSTPAKTGALGANVTSQDAIDTCYSIIFSYMTSLLKSPYGSTAHQMGRDMVSRCAGSEDLDFLPALYKHMLEHGLKDTLLQIQGKDLENWLLAKKEKEDPRLILNYYQAQGKNLQAGELANKVACDKDSSMTLDERLEYLTESVAAFGSDEQQSQMNRSEMDRRKREVEDNLRIVELQRRVLQCVESTKFEIEKDSSHSLTRLETQLISASDLYNDFADYYELYEICLLILHATSHNEPDVIRRLWQNLICQNILPCATRYEKEVYDPLSSFVDSTTIENPQITLVESSKPSPAPLFEDGGWIMKVQRTVVEVGQKIVNHGSEFVFPVDFITQCLEETRQMFVNCAPNKDKMTLEWTFSILLEVGVPFATALNCTFEAMKREKISSMHVSGAEQQLDTLTTTIGMLELVMAKYREDSRLGGGAFGDSVQIPIAAVANELRPYIQKVRLDLQQLQSPTAGRIIAALEDRLFVLDSTLEQEYRK